MRLWLLRHGQAEPKARTDAQRNLTDVGRREVEGAAAPLRDQSLQVILVSPYQRAQQTAEIVRQALGFTGPVETVPWLTPDSDPADAMLYLDRRTEQRLLLVTHQPLVGALGGWLVSGHRDRQSGRARGRAPGGRFDAPRWASASLISRTAYRFSFP